MKYIGRAKEYQREYYERNKEKYYDKCKCGNIKYKTANQCIKCPRFKTIESLHRWVRKHKPQPSLCETCNKRISYDLANISQEYKMDLNDWEYLCRSCHMKSDGRINNLQQGGYKERDLKGRFIK